MNTSGLNILFHEHFHGENCAGLGTSHQTGWTGLVAKFIEFYGTLDAKRLLEGGKKAGFKVDFEPKDADPASVGSSIKLLL